MTDIIRQCPSSVLGRRGWLSERYHFFFVVQNKALKSLLVTVLLFGGIICTVYPFQQCNAEERINNRDR